MNPAYASRTQATLVLGGVTLVAFGVAQQVGDPVGEYLALGLVLVAGFPHGADDVHLLRRTIGAAGRDLTLRLVLAYVSVAALVLLLWYGSPACALLGFLALSAYHFGSDHAASLRLRGARREAYGMTWGTFAILAPLCWHADAFAPVIAAMVGAAPPAGLLQVGAAGAGLFAGVAAGVAALGYGLTGRREWLAEIGLLALLSYVFAALPPLWGFAFFFTCVHATTSVYNQLTWAGAPLTAGGIGAFLRRGAPYALVAVAGVVAAASALGVDRLTPDWYAYFLIAVSALTAPHALVVRRAVTDYETLAHVDSAVDVNSLSHV